MSERETNYRENWKVLANEISVDKAIYTQHFTVSSTEEMENY